MGKLDLAIQWYKDNLKVTKKEFGKAKGTLHLTTKQWGKMSKMISQLKLAIRVLEKENKNRSEPGWFGKTAFSNLALVRGERNDG